MKVKDCKKWKKIYFEDRCILRADLELMSSTQKANLEEMEVIRHLFKGTVLYI